MKNVLFIAALVLLASWTPVEQASPPGERSIGFTTMLPDHKFHLGTEAAIQVVKDLDKVWAKRDYKAMKKFFVDTAKCYFPDGTVTGSPDEFIAKLKADSEGMEISWTFDYVYSVDLDPTRGGEHVQAGFTGTSKKEGKTDKTSYHEWYYVVDGKIVMWRQYKMDILE
jgi:hypothetical protein